MAEAEVINIHGGCSVPPPTEPVPGVVKLLEELLERAKQGQVRSVAYVWIDVANSIVTNYAGTHAMTQILGAIRMLEHDLIAEYVADARKHD